MGKKDSIAEQLKRLLAALDTAGSLFERHKIGQKALWVWTLLGSGAVTLWAWIESNLPYWGMAILFLVMVLILLGVAWLVVDLKIKRKSIGSRKPIDIDKLASDIDETANGVFGLLAEHREEIQEGWEKDTQAWDKARADDSEARPTRTHHQQAEGRLVQRFGARHHAAGMRLLEQAKHLGVITQSDLWHVSHGIRGASDIDTFAQLLVKAGVAVRHGRK